MPQPPRLLHLAAHTPGLDWEDPRVPESISFQLYQHAHKVHRARFAPVLAGIRLWPADKIALLHVALEEHYTKRLLDCINTGTARYVHITLRVSGESCTCYVDLETHVTAAAHAVARHEIHWQDIPEPTYQHAYNLIRRPLP
jgi:hypothetical protein